MNNFTIREMPSQERPRERLIQHGPGALSNSELIALVLRTGTPSENILSLSNRILSHFDLRALARATIPELKSISGIADAKACQIAAIFELARRFSSLPEESRPAFASPRICYSLIAPRLSDLKQEHFICMYLDTKKRLIREETISIGTLDASVVHPRDVFKGAVSYSASSIILAHNHPSGDPEPSTEDIALTSTLADAGRLMGISILDHIVVGDGRFVSLKERGLL
ncbi:MAG: DNA repair protein RadC [Candidatus Hydrothermarchaeaceae archaeon]